MFVFQRVLSIAVRYRVLLGGGTEMRNLVSSALLWSLVSPRDRTEVSVTVRHEALSSQREHWKVGGCAINHLGVHGVIFTEQRGR